MKNRRTESSKQTEINMASSINQMVIQYIKIYSF